MSLYLDQDTNHSNGSRVQTEPLLGRWYGSLTDTELTEKDDMVGRRLNKWSRQKATAGAALNAVLALGICDQDLGLVDTLRHKLEEAEHFGHHRANDRKGLSAEFALRTKVPG